MPPKDSSPAASPTPTVGKRAPKRAASDAGSATGTDAPEYCPPPPARRRTKKYSSCVICGCDPDKNKFFNSKIIKGKEVNEGPGCLNCYKTYIQGNFSMMLPSAGFDEFCLRCGDDPDLKAKVIKAGEVREDQDGQRPFFPSQIACHSSQGYKASVALLSYTEKEFVAKYNVTPACLGLRLVDLVFHLQRHPHA